MGSEITPDLEAMVQSILRGGRYDTESAVLREALSVLQQRDQLRKAIEEGIAELDRGEGIASDEVFGELEDIMIGPPKGQT